MDYTVFEKSHLYKFHLHRSMLKRTVARTREVLSVSHRLYEVIFPVTSLPFFSIKHFLLFGQYVPLCDTQGVWICTRSDLRCKCSEPLQEQ